MSPLRLQRLTEARSALRIAADRVVSLSDSVVTPDEMQDLADAYAAQHGDTRRVQVERQRLLMRGAA